MGWRSGRMWRCGAQTHTKPSRFARPSPAPTLCLGRSSPTTDTQKSAPRSVNPMTRGCGGDYAGPVPRDARARACVRACAYVPGWVWVCVCVCVPLSLSLSLCVCAYTRVWFHLISLRSVVVFVYVPCGIYATGIPPTGRPCSSFMVHPPPLPAGPSTIPSEGKINLGKGKDFGAMSGPQTLGSQTPSPLISQTSLGWSPQAQTGGPTLAHPLARNANLNHQRAYHCDAGGSGAEGESSRTQTQRRHSGSAVLRSGPNT